MRYRLKSVVKPAKKFTGGVLVGAAFFVLCMTSGYVTLAFDAGTGADVLFDGQNPAACALASAREWEGKQRELRCLDEAGFAAFLAALPMDQLTGNYSYDDGARETILIWDTPRGTLSTVFYEKAVKVVPLYGERAESAWYAVPGGMDWARFDAFFELWPALDLVFEDENGGQLADIGASLWYLEQNGAVLEDRTGSPEDVSGIFGYEEAARVRLSFSLPVREYSVTVEPESGAPCTLYPEAAAQTHALPREAGVTLYRVWATLAGEAEDYNAEFRFTMGGKEG